MKHPTIRQFPLIRRLLIIFVPIFLVIVSLVIIYSLWRVIDIARLDPTSIRINSYLTTAVQSFAILIGVLTLFQAVNQFVQGKQSLDSSRLCDLYSWWDRLIARGSEPGLRRRLEAMKNLSAAKKLQHLREDDDGKGFEQFRDIANFFEMLAIFVEHSPELNKDLTYDFWGSIIQKWWNDLGDMILEMRDKEDPSICEHFHDIGEDFTRRLEMEKKAAQIKPHDRKDDKNKPLHPSAA